ncbi:MAG: hypothetical protein U1E73_00730 [Planctomycetota bacterium]
MPATHEAAAFWIRRYLAQDLVGKLAAAAWAWTALPDEPTAGVDAGSCAIVEIAAFYAVVWLRARTDRSQQPSAGLALGLRIVREYGPAELVDLVTRPLAFGLAFATGIDAVAAVLLGSSLADLAFYGVAIAACRRIGVASRRSGAEAVRHRIS